MKAQEIQARVINVIAKTQKIPADTIQLDQTIQSLCPHSLDLVTLIFEFEDEFSVRISDDELKELKTVKDIVIGIEKLLERKKIDTAATT